MNLDNLQLRGRVAIVTGGSRGIGRVIVALLAELGADVVVNYLKGEKASEAAVNTAIAFLCSDWAQHITGEILNVNGGSILCG